MMRYISDTNHNIIFVGYYDNHSHEYLHDFYIDMLTKNCHIKTSCYMNLCYDNGSSHNDLMLLLKYRYNTEVILIEDKRRKHFNDIYQITYETVCKLLNYKPDEY